MPLNQDMLNELEEVRNGTRSELAWSDRNITDDDVLLLIEAVVQSNSFVNLQLKNNPITDVGIRALAGLLTTSDALFAFDLRNTQVTDEGIKEFSQVLACSRNCCQINLDSEAVTAESYACFEAAILAHSNPNLIDASPLSDPVQAYCEAQITEAEELADAIIEVQDPYCFTTREWNRFFSCNYLISSALSEEAWGHFQTVLAFINRLPLFTADTIQSPEQLVTADENGVTPLDNPKIWKEFPGICEALAKAGTPLTLKHLLETNRDGESFLLSACACAPLKELMAGLHASNLYIRSDLIKAPDSKAPSALLECVIDRGQHAINILFSKNNWVGASSADFRSAYAVVPKDVREQIPNTHQLTAKLSADPHSHAKQPAGLS